MDLAFVQGRSNFQVPIEVFWGELSPCDHLLQIYEDDEVFLNSLFDFVWAGFQNNESVVIIATPAHIAGREDRIRLGGLDLDSLKQENRFFAIDADEALSRFMVNDWPVSELFQTYVSSLLCRARINHSRVRVFGEMVALLWERRHRAATIRMENLWTKFCADESFSLFCAYPKSGFTTDAHESLEEICSHHSKVFVT